MLSSNTVAIASAGQPTAYPIAPPFRMGEAYPEFRGRLEVGDEHDITYKLFRQLMRGLEMDINHFSSPSWNPLGEIIRPGQKILIKPNLVTHLHLRGGNYQAVVTHGSLVRCVLDYVALALNGQGEIIVGDAPIQSADFDKIVERTGLQEICEDVAKTWEIPVRLVDFRLWSVRLDDEHQIVNGSALKGDPAGYVAVNLGERSLLTLLNGQCDRFRVTNYDCRELKEHHNSIKHEYLIPRAVLDADVVINLPKLKTHRKVGLTAALKNIVGINGHKDWLPHHRCGSLIEGGDEYKYPCRLKRIQTHFLERIDQNPYSRVNTMRRLANRILARLNKYLAPDPFLEGSWFGNDTLWRTVLDLNRILVYADKEGFMRESSQRQCFTVVDAIIAGEGEGPMEPESRSCGILAAGTNPAAMDSILCTMMGFDYRKIPLIASAFSIKDWPLVNFEPSEINISSSDDRWKSLKVGDACTDFGFKPPSGWLGHVESYR
ncbi:MAG: DUF362 domain-containing protein [Candidatus Hodarchaeota archaeon]